jgi:exodeoxyribonuclease V gamma subunit
MLHIHRAERADGLVRALGALLAEPLGDPFAREVLAVPTRGIERWLTQQLSAVLGAGEERRDGVCANVDFPTPRRLVGDAVAAAAGIDPDADPWLPERAVWPLLELVEESLGEPWLRSLAGHLGGGADPDRRARRFATVRHIADLFDRYALHRPDMVRAWAAGDDAGIPADGAWQAELWRRLQARIPAADPAERLAGACARLREEPELAGLPARVSLFGLTRLPAGRVDVLRALAAARDVHLFVLHPSPALWARVAETTRGRPRIARRREDATATLPANRLLASWGHDARELQLVLAGAEEHADHHHPVAQRTDTLLGRIQADVREDREPAVLPLLDPGDRSVQVHSCHGRARQVEVLHDAILHLLDDDPSLEPRDVIVMCPDIETFAPLIQATFGAGDVADDETDEPPPGLRPPDLRVRLADRSLRQTNPILAVVARLIELADERLTASQVLDLVDRDPVRRRFGLDDADVARLEEWVRASGIRWGLDAGHRAPFKLDGLATGTWQAGIDRLLVGVTMSEDEQRLFADVLPLDDVESGAIDLAGRFAELLERLRASLDALGRRQPIADWATAIADAARALTDTGARDAWQYAELQRLLDDVVAEAAGSDVELALAEVRALLADRLRGRPTRANFRTGHLTVCTLVPMRSVPHRVVCLLGLDDGVFPRRAPRDGDDLMLADPRVGERDARTEDRQQLLDALMAATDRLIVTYTGNDERTNLPRPPAVPVGELLDVVERAGAAREQVVVRHPLQPFDERNFAPGALVHDRVWSFDGVTLRGALALGGERAAAGPFLPGPLPPLEGALVELDDLVEFVRRPVRRFLRRRLGISVGEYADDVRDALAVELDPRDESRVGQRLLEARLTGAESRAAALAEIRRGTLPPGVLGRPVIDRVHPVVEAIVAQLPAGDAGSLDVKVALAGARILSGTVPGLCGDVLRTVTYARVSPRHRLVAWVRLLALTAAHPERPFAALTVGRAGAGSDAAVTIARIPPLDAEPEARRALALDHLAVLVDLYDRGMREPPPLACLASAAYAAAARDGRDPDAAARGAWESAYQFDREDREPEHRLALGGVVPFAELVAEPARADERGPWWDPDEPRRFGRWARRLWDGLLQCEEVEDR